MTQNAVTGKGFRTFFWIWLGQTVSILGSGLTAFVLGYWVYSRTGSATQFALITAAASLPGVLLAPFTGALVDRYDRRRLMMAADVGAALCTGALALLYLNEGLQVWHIWALTAVASAFNTLKMTCYTAITPLLVPREQLGRVNGLVQTGQALGIISPIAAGLLIGLIGVPGVIGIDFATFLFAVTVLMTVVIPRPEATTAGARGRGSLRREAAYGFTYLREHRGLLWLVGLFGTMNFFVSLSAVLVMPLILSFTDVKVAGVLYGLGGGGMVLGGLALSAWGGPKRKINGVLGFMALGGFALFLHGLVPSPWLIAFVAPLFLCTVPFVNGGATAILQTRVPTDVLGRVFATATMLARVTTPVAYLLAGPLADRVFEPLMKPGGALAPTVGAMIGTGQGRGIALMFMVSGAATLAAAIVGWMNPRLRRVEDPDAPAAAPSLGIAPDLAVAGD